MGKHRYAGALACVSAVVGAGFASGREIVTFFTRYGSWSWLLILLSTSTMSALCLLTLRATRRNAARGWHELYRQRGRFSRAFSVGCRLALFSLIAGAMLAASASAVALLVPLNRAYEGGLILSLLLAFWLAGRSVRCLSWFGGLLTALLLAAYLPLMAAAPPQSAVQAIPAIPAWRDALRAPLNAVAYGSMNMAVALGVVCECVGKSRRELCRMSVLFGFLLTCLLFVANALYLRAPASLQEELPLIALLRGFGRAGYLLGLCVFEVSVFTTLLAAMRGLRGMLAARLPGVFARDAALLSIPFLVSLLGFRALVETFYAPLGILCLAAVFAPLAFRRKICTDK